VLGRSEVAAALDEYVAAVLDESAFVAGAAKEADEAAASTRATSSLRFSITKILSCEIAPSRSASG
jgi:hypothetical protein